MGKITVFTYNLLINTATEQLDGLVSEMKPDIVAVQEVLISGENLTTALQKPYVLADFSNCHIQNGKLYGIATYYNRNTIDLVSSDTLSFSFSFYEFLVLLLRGNKPRSMLKTVFKSKKSGKEFHFYNLHLSPYGSNNIRKKQMYEAFEFIGTDNVGTVITGDFNFPYGRKGFETITKEYNLSEATTNIDFSFQKNWLGFIPLKFKLDYILYKNLKHAHTVKLSHTYSDHFPILAEFEI
ncbi:MAG: endonuclease/exonuclease/phosphatase family protein [Candidatus Roizmanbacteria bacterium]